MKTLQKYLSPLLSVAAMVAIAILCATAAMVGTTIR